MTQMTRPETVSISPGIVVSTKDACSRIYANFVSQYALSFYKQNGRTPTKDEAQQYVIKIFSFPTDKWPFFTRFNAAWGSPETPFLDWGLTEQKIFVDWYYAHNYYFDDLDNTIRDIVNLDGDNTVTVRNALAGLIRNANKGSYAPSHTDLVFGLGYDRWNTTIIPLLMRHYPYYKFYVEKFQLGIIDPYWNARTAEETKKRQDMIIAVSIAVGAGILTIITLGATGKLAESKVVDAVAVVTKDVVKATTGVAVNVDLLKTGINGVITGNYDPNELMNNIGNNASQAANSIADAIKKFNVGSLTPNLSLSPEDIGNGGKLLNSLLTSTINTPKSESKVNVLNEEKTGSVLESETQKKIAIGGALLAALAGVAIFL